MRSTSFFNTSSVLLINGSKKEVILKNILVENILGLIRTPENASYRTAINDTISEMKKLSPKVYADGISILKQYYYVTSFTHFANKDTVFDFS